MRHDVTIQTVFYDHSTATHLVEVDAVTGNEAASLGRADFLDGEFYQEHGKHIARVYVIGIQPTPLPTAEELDTGAEQVEAWLDDADRVRSLAPTKPAPPKPSPSKRGKASVPLNKDHAINEENG